MSVDDVVERIAAVRVAAREEIARLEKELEPPRLPAMTSAVGEDHSREDLRAGLLDLREVVGAALAKAREDWRIHRNHFNWDRAVSYFSVRYVVSLEGGRRFECILNIPQKHVPYIIDDIKAAVAAAGWPQGRVAVWGHGDYRDDEKE